MATVRELKWYPTTWPEACPTCGRIRPLGKLNDGSSTEARCIDCTIGPPEWLWKVCPKCGGLEVNPEENCYGCRTGIYALGVN